MVRPETPRVCCSPDITPSTYCFVADGVALPLTNVGVVADGVAELVAVEKKGVEDEDENEDENEDEEGCRKLLRLNPNPNPNPNLSGPVLRLTIRQIIIMHSYLPDHTKAVIMDYY